MRWWDTRCEKQSRACELDEKSSLLEKIVAYGYTKV